MSQTANTFEHFIIGGAIGFVVGYIVRYLQEIRDKVEEVDHLMKGEPVEEDQHGFMRYPIVQDIAVLLAVALTAWAAFTSQHATNDFQDSQDKWNRVTFCTEQFLSDALSALNGRTAVPVKLANSNISLQKAQLMYITSLLTVPPPNRSETIAGLQTYLQSLTDFVHVGKQTTKTVNDNPFPTNQQLDSCLHPK